MARIYDLRFKNFDFVRILIVSRYKEKYPSHQAPFVTEQAEAIRALGHEIEYYLVRGSYIKQYFALRKKIKEWRPDIIHAHYGLTAILAELQGMVPVVTTFHNGETHNWYVNLIASLMSLRAKHVIYVAQHIYNKVYFKATNYSIIPCGINLEDCFLTNKAEARKELEWEQDRKYILFGGAFYNLRKNYPLLREAVERLMNERISELGNEWTKIEGGEMLGDVACMEMWKRTRRECMLMMNAADVFALPTKNEGSPQALKEAMAVNCPVIATDITDIRYMLGDVSGHYVLENKRGTQADWVGDESSVDELAGLLKKALAFEGRTKGRERLVEIAYTNDLIAKKIVEIYKSILKNE